MYLILLQMSNVFVRFAPQFGANLFFIAKTHAMSRKEK